MGVVMIPPLLLRPWKLWRPPSRLGMGTGQPQPPLSLSLRSLSPYYTQTHTLLVAKFAKSDADAAFVA